MAKKKMQEKELVLIVEVRLEISHLDYIYAISEGIEKFRESGSAEIVDARIEEKSND